MCRVRCSLMVRGSARGALGKVRTNDDPSLLNIGRWGEAFVASYLRWLWVENLGDDRRLKFEGLEVNEGNDDDDNGDDGNSSGATVPRVGSRRPTVEWASVNWVNETVESLMPFDIILKVC